MSGMWAAMTRSLEMFVALIELYSAGAQQVATDAANAARAAAGLQPGADATASAASAEPSVAGAGEQQRQQATLQPHAMADGGDAATPNRDR